MRFLNLYPFLAMMYHDRSRLVFLQGKRDPSRSRLFFGLGDKAVDDRLRGTVGHPELLIRFNEIDTQTSTANPTILFVINNGFIRRARSSRKNFVDDFCRCLCEAEETKDPSMRIFTGTERIPLQTFARYYGNSDPADLPDTFSSR